MKDSLRYQPITGRGVDRLERRKETGSLKEITENELRKSVERSINRIAAGLKQLADTFRARNG